MSATIEEVARALYAAERDAAPIAPIAAADPALTLVDAYRIQSAGRALRLAEGGEVVGHKVGLTSLAMQEMLGVDQPDFGYLLAAMVHGDGVVLDRSTSIAPRAEAEIAFRLAAPLAGPDVTREDVLAATDAVAPAIEVIDSRIADWRIGIVDTVADNASCGCVVLGPWRSPEGLDLAASTGTMTVTTAGGAEEVASGPGAAVLGHPAEAVAWLVRALHGAAGESLAVGEVVLPGAVARALPIGSGDRVHVHFDGIGVVQLTMDGGPR